MTTYPTDSWTCDQCGEEMPTDYAVCWNCAGRDNGAGEFTTADTPLPAEGATQEPVRSSVSRSLLYFLAVVVLVVLVLATGIWIGPGAGVVLASLILAAIVSEAMLEGAESRLRTTVRAAELAVLLLLFLFYGPKPF